MITISAATSLVLILLAFAMSLFRVLRGPTLQDRVVALDLIAYLSLGFVVGFAVISDEALLLDVVLIATPVISLGTITIAIYLKKRLYDA